MENNTVYKEKYENLVKRIDDIVAKEKKESSNTICLSALENNVKKQIAMSIICWLDENRAKGISRPSEEFCKEIESDFVNEKWDWLFSKIYNTVINHENITEAECEKDRFVSGHYIRCTKTFDYFIEGYDYWFEYAGDDMYVGRSEEIKDKKYHITPMQLYTNFTSSRSIDNNMPKFKIGDLIVNRNSKSVLKVKDIKDMTYGLASADLETDYPVMGYLSFNYVESEYDKWNIDNAENGDVLVCQNFVFIYRKTEGQHNLLWSYCYMDMDLINWLDNIIQGRYNDTCRLFEKSLTRPATERERRLLFDRIEKEKCGFWDEKEKTFCWITSSCDYNSSYKRTWNADDENFLTEQIHAYDNSQPMKHTAFEFVNWLLSLKKRLI
jgi:hypothetical protein